MPYSPNLHETKKMLANSESHILDLRKEIVELKVENKKINESLEYIKLILRNLNENLKD